MRKLLYILPVILILGFAACENYVDITPTGKKTVVLLILIMIDSPAQPGLPSGSFCLVER